MDSNVREPPLSTRKDLYDGDQDIAANYNCFVSSIESQERLFFIMTGWFQYRVSGLPDEECAQA